MPLTINRELTNESTVNCGAFRYTQDAADVVSLDHTGWYTNPFGEAFKDGSGLCHGVVARLAGGGPARFVAAYRMGGPARFVAAYRMGDHDEDDAGTFAMQALYVATSSDESDIEQAGQDAARAADQMASMVAELEAEYQAARQAGQEYSQEGETIATARDGSPCDPVRTSRTNSRQWVRWRFWVRLACLVRSNPRSSHGPL